MFSIFRRPYYCGSDVSKCTRSARHSVWYNSGGKKVCPECQKPLVAGKRSINFSFLTFLLLLMGAIFWTGYRQVFPQVISGVFFSTVVSEIMESAGVVEVHVKLSDVADHHPITINYRTVAGSAEDKKDFQATQGQLIFNSGESEKTIVIPITQDRDSLENNENFFIYLDNVIGNPKHTIIIREEGVNKDLLDKADLLVSSLSTLAAKMANQLKSIYYIQDYSRDNINPAEEIEERYYQIQSNLRNASEKYLLLFHKASELDPVVLNSVIENRIAALQRGEFQLQFLATQVMQQQLKRFLDTQIPETSTWVKELSGLVQDRITKETLVLDKDTEIAL